MHVAASTNDEHFEWYDNECITLKDYAHIFHNLSLSEQWGVALSDEDGKILWCNAGFKKTIPFDLRKLEEHCTESVKVTPYLSEFTWHPISGKITLNRFTLPYKQKGPAFLWLLPTDKTIKNYVANSQVYDTFIMRCQTSVAGNLLEGNPLFTEHFAIQNTISQPKINALFEDPLAFERLKERVLAKKEILNEAIQYKKLNGQLLTGLTNCRICSDEQGKETLYWEILDISKQVQHEQELQAKNEQLEKVNSQMERFLYSTSHDLRSPLTSILGLVNLLKAETKEKALLEYVTKIEGCTLKLDNIIKDIITFSKTTYQRIKSVRIDIEKMIWKVIKGYSIFPDFHRISFEVNVTGDSIFYSDHDRMEIIFNNLIRNAITFFDAQKVKPSVRLNVTIAENDLAMEIIDNGVGIPAKHQQQVFNMFYKASDRSHGTGLGLYIVKESIHQLNGRISLESEVGFGTVFRCFIPNDAKGRLINRKLRLKQSA